MGSGECDKYSGIATALSAAGDDPLQIREAHLQANHIAFLASPTPCPPTRTRWPYLSDLNMLVLLNGRERTRGDFERLCTRSGFTVTGVAPVTPDHSVIVAG